MDPLTILMWIGIVIGSCIALYLLLYVLVILCAFGLTAFICVLTLLGIRKGNKQVKIKRRARHPF